MSDVTTIEADVPERYADAVQARLAAAAERAGRRADLGARRDAVGAGGHARGDRPARLAGHRRAHARAGRRPDAFVAEVRDAGYTDAVLLGMGGSSLAPEVFRRSFGTPTDLTLHVLDSTHPDQVQAVLDEVDLDKAIMIVSSKSGGTIEPNSHVQGVPRPPAGRRALRRGHRPGQLAGEAGAGARVPADLRRATRRSAGATARCRRSASSRPRSPASTSRPCSTPRSAPPRRPRRRGQPGPALGARSGELAQPGPRQADVRRRRAARGLRAVGRAAASPSPPASRASGILPIADEPLVDAGAYGDDRVFLHLEHGGGARRRPARRRAPGDHRARARRRTTSAGCSSCRSSPSPWPAGRWGSTRSTSPTCRRPRTTPSGCSTEGRPSSTPATCASCWRAGAAALRGDHGLPAVLRRDRGGDRPAARATGRASTTSPRRSATARASCTRPGQLHKGGPKTGRSCRSSTTRERLRDSGRAVHLRHAGPRPGRRRPADASRPRPGGRPRRVGDIEGDQEHSDAARLRRPRQDGRQHGPPHPPRLGP